MERSELRRSLLDYLKARGDSGWTPGSVHDFRLHTEGEPAPAPLPPPDFAAIGDALEELALEGFIERRTDGSYHLAPSGVAVGRDRA
jgi:hypothetical protein